MFKKVSFLAVIITSILIILWSGNYIYNKQSKTLDFSSYIIADSASTFYIPNANQFTKKNITFDTPTHNNLPVELLEANVSLAVLKDYDFNSLISQEIYVSYYKNDFSVVFKNYDLTISKIIKQLLDQLKITAVAELGIINFNDSKYFFKKDGDFFIFSTKEIKAKTSKYEIKNKGNFDFSIQNTPSTKTIYHKHSNGEVYQFSLLNSKNEIFGKAIDPQPYFKVIPSNFDQLSFYGSNRITKDIGTLLKSKNQDNFFSWIENSVLYLRKDSLELMIGIQNNLQNLKYILDENTLELSSDSLLPIPIFKNNFEINFFETNYNWQEILPESVGSFNVYTELNNYNILATSMEAINWYIKEIQLGNSFFDNASNISVPQSVNRLSITQKDSSVITNVDYWIDNTKYFHSKTTQDNTTQPKLSSTPLQTNFLVNQTISELSSFTSNDTIYLLMSNSNNLICHNIDGNLIWNKKLKSPLLKSPVRIKTENSTKLVLFMENQIDIIDLKGKSITGFPYEYNGASRDGIIIKYDQEGEYRIIININNKLINLDISGNPIEGWCFNQFNGKLKSKIHYNSIKGKDYIYFKDNSDTLHVLNRKGEERFEKKFQFKSSNQSPFIIGDITNGSLRVLNYKGGYIRSKYINDGHTDSIKLNRNTGTTKAKWIQNNNKTHLLIEEYDNLLFFNEFGFLENETQKPQPNLTHLTTPNFNINYTVFGNLTKNQLYLLNRFGTQINSNPINGNSIFTFVDGLFIVYFNSQIWVYNLN